MHYFCRVLHLLYPSVCGICGKIHPNGLCKKCEITLKKELFLKIDYPKTNQTTYFRKHIYIAKYTGTLRQKIIEYKFQQHSYLYEFFSYLFLKEKKMCVLFEKYDIILPVPVHKKRKAKRGYNQCELIAKEIVTHIKKLKLETSSLIKIYNNTPQIMLNREGRKQNPRGVYRLQSRGTIKGKKILLFDDVYTTGSTVKECAKLLIEQGQAELVDVLTIAKD